MILFRCFAWNETARPGAPDSALWFPRMFQGEGRHDNPDLYGCLYVADRAVSCVAEQLARFRSQRLTPSLLRRRGLPLALAELRLAEDATLVDLDDPVLLHEEHLRPSQVATRQRLVTQPQARHFYERGDVAGLRWWSTYEALWTNVTLFDRAAGSLRAESVETLTVDHPAVAGAAELFGLRV